MADIIMNPEPIAYRDYVESFRANASHVVPLSRELENAKPDDIDSKEAAALAALLAVGDDVEVIINERADFGAVRPFLQTMGNCYGAAYDALTAKSRIPPAMGDTGERAQNALAKVFPDGIMFIRADARAAWFHANRTYRRILSLGIKAELEDLIGAELVTALRKSVNDAGEALGVGKTQRAVPSRTGLQAVLLRFSRAVAKYCRALASNVDEDDPQSVARFRRAVAPIDEYRAAVRAGRVSEEEEPTAPEQPSAPADPAEPSDPVHPVMDPIDPTPTT